MHEVSVVSRPGMARAHSGPPAINARRMIVEKFIVKKCEVFRTSAVLLAQTLFREFEINNHA